GWRARRAAPTVEMDEPVLRGVQRAAKLARAVVPVAARRRFWEGLGPRSLATRRDQAAAAADAASVDWPATRAFALPSDVESHIRVNLAGREPQGIVRPGEEYRTLCRDLAAGIEALAEAETGRRVVRRVHLVEDEIGRPIGHGLPDVVVDWRPGLPVRRLESPGLGVVDVPRTDPRSGNHRPPGFLIAAGRGTGSAPSGASGDGGFAWPDGAVDASLLDV